MDKPTNPTPVPLTLECRLINASIAAYHIKNNQIDPSAPGYAQIGIKQGTTPVCFTRGIDQIDAGYVVETQDNWVFLVFRGTLPPFEGDFFRWVLDWMNDFRLGPTTWMVNGKSFGQAETGFASAVLDLWPQALDALTQINLPAMNGIIVAGHSKGAALSFLAASLLKGQYFPNLLVEVSGFAAPLVTDRTFRDNYNRLGLRSFSVRYQNEYDAVPFLPYLPTWDLLSTAERLSSGSGENVLIKDTFRQQAIENDYVPLGMLRYITTNCDLEYGEQGETDAWKALEHALLFFEFTRIVDAHSAAGRYLTCVCQ
ncbi:MAG TPA: lipase family protein [Pyrinomonadaceae bacterium]|nr:lipase family protein [Pyrinomonadaceae bacterium]